MKNAFLFFLVYVSFSTVTYSTGLPASPKVSLCGYGFIENKGQIIDQNYKPNKEVLYLYNGNGLHVQLRQNGFSYEVIKTEKTLKAIGVKSIDQNYIPNKFEQDSFDYTYKIHRVDISFEGGNKNVLITPYEPSSDYINYYTAGTSENGITNIHHYQKVLYANIYPNIDVEFVLNPENISCKFKYNFIIHPGGNINDIKLKFLGATNTSLTEDGHITIETAYGNIDESIPYSYQLNDKNQQTVLSKFSYTGPTASSPAFAKATAGRQEPVTSIFGIEVKNYDPTKTLVIDPTPWATYFGGSSGDYSNGVTFDLNGNILFTGETFSTNGIATSGAHQTSINGQLDAYIVKLNGAGLLQWATYYGGTAQDLALGIATDMNNNIFIAGYTGSTSNIGTSGSYHEGDFGSGDGFIAKFSPAGTRIWGTYYGGFSADGVNNIAIDFNGNVLVTGYTYSVSYIATSGVHQTIIGGSKDGFLAKFSNAGAFLWGSYYGGTSSDYINSIAADLNGDIVITGRTFSNSGIATTGAFQNSIGGSGDGFLAKLSGSGTLIWATYYGGTYSDEGFGICTDTNGNYIISGFTNSSNGIASVGAYQPLLGGSLDVFIAKFSPSGIRQWGTYFGNTGNDVSKSLATDLKADIFITGLTYSFTGIATSGTYQTTHGGGSSDDAFIAKFNTSGILQWATYFGGNLNDDGNDIAISSNGNLIISGSTASSSGIATPGAWQTSNGGFWDAFVFSLPVSPGLPSITINTISSDQGICAGTIPAAIIGSTPNGGDGNFVYTWLSSTTGSTSGFTLASGTNNTINYSPPALSNNTWYKRVVSSGTYFDTSNVIAITVGSKLNVGFTVNQLIQCIKTNNFIFTDTTTATGTITRLWDFGNGTTSTLANPNISYNFNIANAYWVKLESSVNGTCVDSARQRVFVISNPAPTGAIIGNTVVNRLNTYTYSVPASMGSSYQWIFTHGVGSSTSNSINIKWNEIGTVDLKLIEFTGGGCAGDTVYQSITINPGVGFEGFERNDAITIYPNPSDGIVQISRANPYSSTYQNSSLQIIIYDMQGKPVYQNFWPENMDKIELDISSLNDGIYSLQLVEPDGNTYMKKLQLMK
ncbi:MAG: SBBP repeat-containing protein [Bacteroidota bacterium]|nr:SBBP repeat-containing protein [Bacteroidota bacterium]